jgi:hypothetical protein
MFADILQSYRVAVCSAHSNYGVLLDMSRDLLPSKYFLLELLCHLYDVFFLVTKG